MCYGSINSDLSPEFDLFLWQIAGRELSNNFALYTDGKDLKVAPCQINFCLVEHFSPL